MHDKVMGQTLVGAPQAYASSSSAYCDLDVIPNEFVLVFFLNPTMRDKLWAGHKQVWLTSMHKVLTVPLTFELLKWLLFATYSPVMMIICAKTFIYLTMHHIVMGQHKHVSLKPMQKI